MPNLMRISKTREDMKIPGTPLSISTSGFSYSVPGLERYKILQVLLLEVQLLLVVLGLQISSILLLEKLHLKPLFSGGFLLPMVMDNFCSELLVLPQKLFAKMMIGFGLSLRLCFQCLRFLLWDIHRFGV